MVELLENLVPILIACGISLDLFSCFLFLRRNRHGPGASGVPLVSFIVFYFFPLFLSGNPVFTSSIWTDCGLLLCFHIVVVFLIPVLDRKWLTG